MAEVLSGFGQRSAHSHFQEKEDQEKEYIQSVIKADFAEAGDEDVFRKVKEDLKNHNISDEDIRIKMEETLQSAKKDFS